jgi:glucose-6-phosphate-specific signal transduction histidine kinase
MKCTGKKIYVAAWLLYLTFIFALFPELKITVMLFSIPLTMLGGWLYLYRGAVITTLATIPVHYLLLSFYSNDPAIIAEALNPFGIASQVLFSCCTALLKSSQNKYNRLNETLEETVAERTQDLEDLANYLIDARNLENRVLNASLLEMPHKELQNMLITSEMLEQKLNTGNHPRVSDAQTICTIIHTCLNQLEAIEKHTSPNIISTDRLQDAIALMTQQIEPVSTAKIQCLENPEWDRISADKKTGIYEIIFEAVSNAVRHAQPAAITIGLETTETETVVYVENDGKPFMTGAKEGMGLPLMRYRAGKIGGSLSVAPTSMNLTRITCTLPADPIESY